MRTPSRNTGFTVVELLAVLFMCLALLMTITAGRSHTQPSASTYHCRNNLRQLALAAKMYADDYLGSLPANEFSASSGKSATEPSWAGGMLDYSAWPDNTNTAFLVDPGHRYPYGAALGPYTKSPAIYKCPSDYSKVRIGLRDYPRVRSVSMNSRVGYRAYTWTNPTRFWMYPSYDKIAHPSGIFFFIDEREDSMNDSEFLVDPDNQDKMLDFPASYHAGAANLSFADGHVETHRWTDPRTTPPLTAPTSLIPLNVTIPGDQDIAWLQSHCAEPR